MRARSTVEHRRLEEARGTGDRKWRRWGTYLPERQWGTVREDYSVDGEAWNYLPFDHASRRAYRWGDDGLLGLCDNRGIVCFCVALWNGVDSILKERLFGLSGNEGNHGEDVKELYWYLDATPTCSYARALYKYPQTAFPYEELRARSRVGHQGRSRARAARHGGVRRQAVLRRRRRVREGQRERRPRPRHGDQPGAPRRPDRG